MESHCSCGHCLGIYTFPVCLSLRLCRPPPSSSSLFSLCCGLRMLLLAFCCHLGLLLSLCRLPPSCLSSLSGSISSVCCFCSFESNRSSSPSSPSSPPTRKGCRRLCIRIYFCFFSWIPTKYGSSAHVFRYCRVCSATCVTQALGCADRLFFSGMVVRVCWVCLTAGASHQ